MKQCMAWMAAWGMMAMAALAGETVVDRQGDWTLIQTDDGASKMLFLEKTGSGRRSPLSAVETPVATVTNVFWDEYAGWDAETGKAAGGMVKRVDTVAAEYRFRAFVNDGRAYWEDSEGGTARLWTAPCKAPGEKTLLAKAAAGTGSAFRARRWRRGAAWVDGAGKAVAWENGETKHLSIPKVAVAKKAYPLKRSGGYEYDNSGDYDYSGSGDYDYSGSGDYDYSGSGEYDYSGSGEYHGSGEAIAFDANGGRFILDGGEEVEILENAASYYTSGGEGYITIDSFEDFSCIKCEGHAFDGWYEKKAGGEPCGVWNVTSLNAERTLYAHWVKTGTMGLDVATDAAGLAFTTGGDGSWFGQTSESHDGTDSARSGLAKGTGETWMETTVAGPGTVSFWWKASCDEGYEDYEAWDDEGNPIGEATMRYWIYAAFAVDGDEIEKLAGDSGWQKASFEVGAGSHTLRWTYCGEDNFLSGGHACAWVDQVTWAGAAPAEQTVTFNANGGTCGTATAAYPIGGTYGSLPEAGWEGHAFEGWWTAAEGGTQVTAASKVTADATRTLYAHWSGGESGSEGPSFEECTVDASGGKDAFKFKFRARAGKAYELQKTDDLTAGDAGWKAVRTVTASEDGAMELGADIQEGENAGYYRMAEKE